MAAAIPDIVVFIGRFLYEGVSAIIKRFRFGTHQDMDMDFRNADVHEMHPDELTKIRNFCSKPREFTHRFFMHDLLDRDDLLFTDKNIINQTKGHCIPHYAYDENDRTKFSKKYVESIKSRYHDAYKPTYKKYLQKGGALYDRNSFFNFFLSHQTEFKDNSFFLSFRNYTKELSKLHPDIKEHLEAEFGKNNEFFKAFEEVAKKHGLLRENQFGSKPKFDLFKFKNDFISKNEYDVAYANHPSWMDKIMEIVDKDPEKEDEEEHIFHTYATHSKYHVVLGYEELLKDRNISSTFNYLYDPWEGVDTTEFVTKWD